MKIKLFPLVQVNALLMIMCVAFWVLSCGKRTISTSTKTTTSSDSVTRVSKEKTVQKDSIVSTKEILKDSSYYSKTMEEKILPGGSIGITVVDGKNNSLDSLITALRNLPSSVTRSVSFEDKSQKAVLTISLDSLNRVNILCTAKEQRYIQTSVVQGRVITSLRDSLVSVRNQLKQYSDSLYAVRSEKDMLIEKVKEQNNLWQRLKNWALIGGLILVLLAAVALTMYKKNF